MTSSTSKKLSLLKHTHVLYTSHHTGLPALALVLCIFFTQGFSQVVRLKKRNITPGVPEMASINRSGQADSNRNSIILMEEGKEKLIVSQLKELGATIMAYVPDNAISVHIPKGVDVSAVEGILWSGQLRASDKLSRHLQIEPGTQHALVEFHPAIENSKAKSVLEAKNLQGIQHPDLPSYNYLVEATHKQLASLAAEDSVAFIQPASKKLIRGERVHYCPGSVTPYGLVAPYVTNGPGWDGSGLGSAELSYYFINSTNDLSTSQQRAEIVRALQTWSQYADITWAQTSFANRLRSMDIGFFTGNHGDPSPFDGTNGILAHAFYPSPPNQETIAGDMHFDDAETFRLNDDIDLYAVALHEAGHALGLNHSSDPSAVMYATYQSGINGLRPDDIAGIRSLYSSIGDGGTQADAYEPDNTSPGNPITSNSPQPKSIFPAGDQDWNRFTIGNDGAEVIIETSGGSGDTQLFLYNSSLTRINFDDDGGSGLFSKITTSLSSGTYYIKVEEFGNDNTIAAYSISLQVSAGGTNRDAYEPDNSSNQATILSPGISQDHSLSPIGDIDYYRFSLAALSEVIIETDGSSGDTRMWLFGTGLSSLEFNDDGGNDLFSKIDRTAADNDRLPAGTYYVAIDEYLGNNEISAYSIKLTLNGSSADDPYEPNNTLDEAYYPEYDWENIPLSDLNGTAVQNENDYYQISVGPGDENRVRVQLLFSHREGDLDLSLHDANGRLIENSISITDNEFINTIVPTTGTYFIKVFGYNASNGQGYDLVWEDLTTGENKLLTAPNDFDGDGVTDLVSFDPPSGIWYIEFSTGKSSSYVAWGDASMLPVPGDYNGDGLADLAMYQPSTGKWFIREVAPGQAPITFGQVWGDSSMLPVSGDYNGDGVFDLAVYQQVTGNWYIRSLGAIGPGNPPITFGQNWGNASMIPVSGDYNGDGVFDLAVYQETTGNWFIRSLGVIGPENPPITFGQNWGDSSMIGVPGDYNGDGRSDLAVYQPSSGSWFIRQLGPDGPQNPPIAFAVNWGSASMWPAPGDYNGDGADDLSVFESATASWFIRTVGGIPVRFAYKWGRPR